MRLIDDYARTQFEDAVYSICSMFNGEWSVFVNGTSGWRDLRIIAWMPLPEPYKEVHHE